MTRSLLIILCLFSVLTSSAQFGNRRLLTHEIESDVRDFYDLDYDGDLDLIIRGQGLVWFENVNGEFPNHPKLVTDSLGSISAIRCADMDGDGDGDVVVYANSGTSLYWLENDGFAYFTIHFILSPVSPINQIDVQDFDNDNDLDIVYNLGSGIKYVEQTSLGVFGAAIVVGSGEEGFKIGDINGDTNPDIVCIQFGQAGYYSSNGNGTFSSFINFFAPSVLSDRIDIADIDGDLDLDLLELSTSDSIRIYEWNGSVFTNMITVDYYAATMTTDVKFIDYDNDSDFDVFSTNWTQGRVYRHENTGGSFAARAVLSNEQGPELLTILDLNLDNYQDVIYATTIQLRMYLNNNGTFSNIGYGVGTKAKYTERIQYFDFDGDSLNDIITMRPTQGGNDPTIAWHKNLGSGDYTREIEIYPIVDLLKTSIFADLDGDSLPDLLRSHYRVNPSNYYRLTWMKNMGNGTFGAEIYLLNVTFGDAYDEIATADLDSDGDLDVLACRIGFGIMLYENLGAAIFAPAVQIATTDLGECEFRDMDGDLDIDIVTNEFNYTYWHENQGSLTFGPRVSIFQATNGITLYTVELDDIDNDGDNDVLAAGNDATQHEVAEIWLGLNDGIGNFTTSVIDSIEGINDIYIADINADSLKDLAVASDYAVGWKENIGNANFGSYNVAYGTNVSQGSGAPRINKILAADLDSDSDFDLIFGAYTSRDWTQVLENFYTGDFLYNGTVFYDDNQNGILDSSDYGLNSLPVNIQPNAKVSFANNNGYYFFATDSGTFTISHNLPGNWNLTSDSATYTQTLSGSNTVISRLDFGYYPAVMQTTLLPDIVGGLPRCNSIVNYWISVKNLGTTQPDGKFHLELDPNVSYISSNLAPDSVLGQNIYWHFDSLEYFALEQIQLQVGLPTVAFIGDTLQTVLTVHELDPGGNSVYQISDTLDQILVCAYDPNDKSVDPIGYYAEHFISANEELEYLIRFQNTGNDTAINVMLRDKLDTSLDWNSIQIISSSHPMSHYFEPDRELVFSFQNIMLPDSGADFLESQGFVKFRISPIAGLNPLTRIYNQCDIYFDLNPAIITNYVFNTIECGTFPVPNITFVNPYLSAGVTGNYIYEWYRNDTLIFGANSDTLTPPQDGLYHVIVRDTTGCYRVSNDFNYVPVGIGETLNSDDELRVFPNPTNGNLNVISHEFGEITVTILNSVGQIVFEQTFAKNQASFDFKSPPGLYFVKVKQNDSLVTKKIVVN